MSNYTCIAAPPLGLSETTTVADAPCQMGYKCSMRFSSGCEYYDRYKAAQHAPVIITNYQCWFYDALKDKSSLHIPQDIYDAEQEFGGSPDDARIPVDMLVCDEADLIESGELARYVGVDVSRRECLHLGLSWPDAGGDLGDWKKWAETQLEIVEERLIVVEGRLASSGSGAKTWSRELKYLRDMKRKLTRLSGMSVSDDWVKNEIQGEGKDGRYDTFQSAQFTPLQPSRFAEQALWRGIKKIVLMSATVRPKTAELLGIDPADMEFIEFPSTFPAKRRPVVHVVSGVQMNYRTEQDDRQMIWWLKKLDAYIEMRLDRKGVIHAVSYKRAQFIKNNSEYGHLMLTHNSHDRAQVVEEFRASEAPCILVSPSVDTGYDFSGDQCRWQVIAKIPFASTQDKLIKERQARDPEYGLYLAAQTIEQMIGRPMRSEDDYAETSIMDDNWFWFYPKVKKFMSSWVQEAISRSDTVPKPIQF